MLTQKKAFNFSASGVVKQRGVSPIELAMFIVNFALPGILLAMNVEKMENERHSELWKV